MKLSRYNIEKKEDKSCLIYNTVTSAILELDTDYEKSYYEMKEGKKCSKPDLESALLEGGMLVEDDKDEFAELLIRNKIERFADSNLTLTIAPTMACNFCCPYCYEKGREYITMSETVQDQLTSQLKEKYQHIHELTVSWYGGEPLLAIETIEKLTKKIKSVLPLGCKYNADMVTNGYKLTRRVAEKLKDMDIHYIQVTLDGSKQAHDSRRILHMDIIENFKNGYSVENAHIIILGGEKEWEERIWKKVVENDFKVMPQKSSLRVPTSLNRNYKNIKENGMVIFLKLNYVCTDTAYYDLVESMALTFLEELFKETGKMQESDIFLGIFQPTKDFRYIRITVRKKINLTCIHDVYKKIVNRLILKKDIGGLLEDLKNEYNNILKKNEYGYQYIQHLIYSYIFDRKSYTNHDLMQYIEAEGKKVFDDIINFSISTLEEPEYYIYYLERR